MWIGFMLRNLQVKEESWIPTLQSLTVIHLLSITEMAKTYLILFSFFHNFEHCKNAEKAVTIIHQS